MLLLQLQQIVIAREYYSVCSKKPFLFYYGRPLPPKIQHVWNELTLSEMIHYILKWVKNTQINELTQ